MIVDDDEEDDDDDDDFVVDALLVELACVVELAWWC